MRYLNFILIFFLLSGYTLYGNSSQESDIEIKYLPDSKVANSLSEAFDLLKKNKFEKAPEDLNFGFRTSGIWLYINLEETDAMQRVLMVNASALDNIDVYFYCNEQQIKSFHTGRKRDFHTRDIEHPNYNFLIPSKATFALARISNEGPLGVPTKIFTLNDYLSFVFKEEAINWMFFGFVTLILITNIFVYLWLRESIYFYFILSTFCLGFITFSLKGYAFQYLWPEFPEINNYKGLIYLTSFTSVLFTEKVLGLKERHHLFYKIFNIIYLCFAGLMLLNFLVPYIIFIKLLIPVLFILMSICLSAGFYLDYNKKVESSRFLFAGWISLFMSIMIFLIYSYGYLPFGFLISNSLQIGVSLQIVFFNIAVLSQINSLKKEKESIISEQNRVLEKKVDERTMELQTTNEELQALNEEFQAMNEELQAMNEEITSQNEMLVEQREELEAQRNSIAEKNEVIEEKNMLLEKHQLFLEKEVDERTKELVLLNKDLGISEERYRKLVENSPEAIVVLDAEGNFFDVNSRACDLFKMTREELLKSNPVAISPEFQFDGIPSMQKAFGYINEAIEGKNPVFEWTHKDATGKNFDAEVWLTRLPSKDKVMIRGSVLDITQKKRHQLELRRREERLRTVVHNVPIILWACDKDSKITFLEGKAIEILNINPEELLNQNILKLFHGDREQQENLEYLFGAMDDFEIQIVILDRTYDLKATRLNDDSNSFAGFIGVLIDVSERIESEKRIRAFVDYQSELIDKVKLQEASLSSLINSSKDMIFSVDRNFNLLEFNTSFKEEVLHEINLLLGKGMNFRLFVPSYRIKYVEESFKKALSGEIVNTFGEIKAINGLKYFSITHSPIFSSTNEITGITVICRDVTEMKQAEHKLLEINKEVADYKLMALRSVMNPHFLFNSLNSIQYYIASSERKLALDYLSIFSLLIRKVLYSSLNPLIPLDEELEVLEYYISLEKLRFENKFISEIIIDPELNIEEVEVPSLLIQPYVENAILHGLLTKNGPGKLTIQIGMEGERLVIIVEDDGIGREKAMEIKANSSIKDKSYGMLVTKERLEIINKTSDVSVIIEDKVNENKEPSGTKVKIFIKL